jgi:DNA (cytosine-5)-methyltransferase 1
MTHKSANAITPELLGARQDQDQPGPLRVMELFAGVGGFHMGLEQVNQQRFAQGLSPAFEVVWANQWEPASRVQHAAQVYQARWGLSPVNRNLFEVLEDTQELDRLDSLAPDVLVGGFPCQDFSVAKPLSQSHGLEGVKGVLWWGIHRLLDIRQQAGKAIQMVILENVDRLLSSPGRCKGRDFAVILASLQALGYAVGWQVVNAADYGCAQRRRRVFIVAVHQSSLHYQCWKQGLDEAPMDWLTSASPMCRGFPVKPDGKLMRLTLAEVAAHALDQNFSGPSTRTPFLKAGVCIEGNIWTMNVRADFGWMGQLLTEIGTAQTIGQVVTKTIFVPDKYFIAQSDLPKWRYVKGSKSEPRVSKSGYAYEFSEGALPFPEPLDRPSRTVLTSEVGASASRTRHVVEHPDGRLRRLTPEEVEELMGFPRGFTLLPGISDARRGFLMGNALLPILVARLGRAIVPMSGEAREDVSCVGLEPPEMQAAEVE